MDAAIRKWFVEYVARGSRLDEAERLVLDYCRRELPFWVHFELEESIVDVCVVASWNRIFVLLHGQLVVLTEDGVLVKKIKVPSDLRAVRIRPSTRQLFVLNRPHTFQSVLELDHDGHVETGMFVGQNIASFEVHDETGNMFLVRHFGGSGSLDCFPPMGHNLWRHEFYHQPLGKIWVGPGQEFLALPEADRCLECRWTSKGCNVHKVLTFDRPVVAADLAADTIVTFCDGRISSHDRSGRVVSDFYTDPSIGAKHGWSFEAARFDDGQLRVFAHLYSFALDFLLLAPITYPKPKSYQI